MSPAAVLVILVAYFIAMALVSWLAGRRKGGQDVFYTGGRKTHWAVVAFAMIGSCMSGVTSAVSATCRCASASSWAISSSLSS